VALDSTDSTRLYFHHVNDCIAHFISPSHFLTVSM